MISYGRQSIDAADVAAVVKVLKGAYLTQGPAVEAFEQDLSEFTGAKHVVACSNGTTALHLAAMALGVGKDSVGFVPAVTCAPTLNSLYFCDVGKVELVDVDAQTGLMDLDALEKSLKKYAKTKHKVVVPVSLQGACLPMKRVARLARKYGAKVIEDAAHSLGAQSGDVHSASCCYSDVAILSFHPVKHITTGEGGAVCTNSKALAQKMARLRSHGIVRPMSKKDAPWYYEQRELGYNYRMCDMQAALGCSQLKKLPKWIAKRRELAARYDKALNAADFEGVLRTVEPVEGSSYHLYCVHFASEKLRNKAWKYLRTQGVNTQVHYVPLHHFPYNKKRLGELKRPGADAYYAGVLSLPLYQGLTLKQQDSVIDALRGFCKAAR